MPEQPLNLSVPQLDRAALEDTPDGGPPARIVGWAKQPSKETNTKSVPAQKHGGSRFSALQGLEEDQNMEETVASLKQKIQALQHPGSKKGVGPSHGSNRPHENICMGRPRRPTSTAQ